MITVADHVRAWIKSHPFHAYFISEGLVNASALARSMRSDIERQVGEKVSLDAIILAVNRYGRQKTEQPEVNFEDFIGEVSVQSGLSILTIPQVDLDLDVFLSAVSRLHKNQEYTLYTRGVWHTELIGKQAIIQELSTHFKNTVIINDLVCVTVKLKEGHLPTPGVCAYILQKIAMQGISLREVTSTHDELTLVLDCGDVNKALSCLV